MPTLHTSPQNVSPPVAAALLLASIEHLGAHSLPRPSATAVIAATGASRSRAYELKARLEALLPTLAGPVGRPKKQPTDEGNAESGTISREVLDYVFRHPGCARGGELRNRYSDGFRRFVLELFERRDVAIELFARECHVPVGTLKGWLRGGHEDVATTEEKSEPSPLRGLHVQTVLDEWRNWEGGFAAFCGHLREHRHVPFGKTIIAHILEAAGVRSPKRRPGRSPDERATRDAFVTFFPHAQWVGDGSMVPVDIDGERFVFNLELDVDTYSDAYLGADVSIVEDSQAVINATRDAEAETGVHPIALLLDNKPSNHTDDVKEALGETMLIPATPYRAQNKAHVEGGFGLFKPTLDGLVIGGESKVELAASVLAALVMVWGRTINHRPRRDRGGRSRVELADQQPTEEQVEAARTALEERLRKLRKAKKTEAARQNPIVRQLLGAAFTRLALTDPNGNILTATARYSLDVVAEAIGIYEGRLRAGTLPPDVDARYLLGIARNIAKEKEAWEVAAALWNERIEAGDLIALALVHRRDELQRLAQTVRESVSSYVDLALMTTSRIDQFFWLTSAADLIRDNENEEALYKMVAGSRHPTGLPKISASPPSGFSPPR